MTARCRCGRELHLNFKTGTLWKQCATCRQHRPSVRGRASATRRLHHERYVPEDAAPDVATPPADLHRVKT